MSYHGDESHLPYVLLMCVHVGVCTWGVCMWVCARGVCACGCVHVGCVHVGVCTWGVCMCCLGSTYTYTVVLRIRPFCGVS